MIKNKVNELRIQPLRLLAKYKLRGKRRACTMHEPRINLADKLGFSTLVRMCFFFVFIFYLYLSDACIDFMISVRAKCFYMNAIGAC